MFYKKYLFIFLIIFIPLIVLVDLFKPGLPLTHDGQDHVARIANFYQNLSEGNIIPRWAGNLNWGYGHPILEFLYPLPSYLASFFHYFGFTLVDSVKLVFGITIVLSGLAMHLFVKELLGDDKAAFFASALYMIAPYRFVDLYVRGAIGEHVVFIFPPLVFYFLLKLSKRNSLRYVIGGAFSFAGLILSHNAIALMFLPLILAYVFYLIFQYPNRRKFIFNASCLMFLGFGLSAFFWQPAFMEGKYTLRDIVTGSGEYKASFVMWKDFFFGQWNYGGTTALSKQIGIVHWMSVLGGLVAAPALYKKKNNQWIVCLGSFFIFWIVLFLMTYSSNQIWQTITILQKFQFPWRFLSVTVFLSAFMGGFLLHIISNKYKKIALLIFLVGLLVVNKDYWHANGFLNKPENFYTGIYNGTTDTGESAPIWSVRFMEKRPAAKVEIIEGYGEIKEIKRSFTKREYLVEAAGKIRVLENTLYFPGWTVLVDGRKVNIEFQDQNYRGLITFDADKGSHRISISYEESKTRLLADIISIVSISMTGGLIIIELLRLRLKKRYNNSKSYDKR